MSQGIYIRVSSFPYFMINLLDYVYIPLESILNLNSERKKLKIQTQSICEYVAKSPDTSQASFQRFWYELQPALLNCKKSAQLYPTFKDDETFVSFKSRPNICGSPYCSKCVKERQNRLMATYLTYVDNEIYERNWLRHIIATSPSFPRHELPERIDQLLNNVSRFHKAMNRSINYPFVAIALLELKHQEDDDTYYFHAHYGVLVNVSRRKMQEVWSRTWGMDLVVKWPDKDGIPGNPVYRTSKSAFIEYVTRRRAEQGLTVPKEDFWKHLQGRQLLKRTGFTKRRLAIVTRIRQRNKKTDELPDGYFQLWCGDIPIEWEITRFEDIFRRRYRESQNCERELITFTSIVFRAFKDSVREYRSKEEDKKHDSKTVQNTLK